MRISRVLGLLALFTLAGQAVRADVTLPKLFTDNLVLQRKAPVRIFGKAEPGEKVTVRIQGKESSAITGENGKWLATLKPLEAGGPFTLTIQGKNTITLNNVLVGEVWLCSGQSNMEWAMRSSFQPQAVIDASTNPQIRLFQVKNVRSDTPMEDVEAAWQECKPETVAGFSAVAYYFARDLQKSLNVPIGLIQSDWGGTPAESWTRESVITGSGMLKDIVGNYQSALTRYEQAQADYEKAAEQAQAEGKPAPRRPNKPWKYAELYNGMIAPLVNYTIKGAIWYQGESNTGRALQYQTLFPTMIQNWRQDFGIPDFPFLLVQLAPFGNGTSPATQYAELREAQYYATKMLKNVGMAVITDVGEERDIHPKKKEPVGARLALLAERIAYGKKVNAFSPTFKEMQAAGNRAIVKFENVGNGLAARGGMISEQEVPAGKLLGFTIAGPDGKFFPAEAEIMGKDTVTVYAAEVPNPFAVRYGFANFVIGNLFSKDGLPASPFRTDAPPVPPGL